MYIETTERKRHSSAPVKISSHEGDTYTILNLGCGTKTSQLCINMDWSYYLIISRSAILRALAFPFLTQARIEKMKQLAGNVMVHNLKHGIPYPDNSVDAVYHSHLLEHLDREVAPKLQAEIFRVLRPGGVQRVCVPDFRRLVDAYVVSYEQALLGPDNAKAHDESLVPLLEQSVRRESFAASSLPPIIRLLERWIAGDARGRGETHQWMYDQINLRELMLASGFTGVTRRCFNESCIMRWEATKLEVDANGKEYKSDSLYMEGVKPIKT